MIHEILPVGVLACNCSVLGDETTGEAVVVDPGGEAEKILAVLKRRKLRATQLVVTHAHLDHVGGLEPLQQATGTAVLMHEADLPLYENLGVQAEVVGIPAPKLPPIDRFLRDGETLYCGKLTLRVLHTPGHSPGGISLYVTGSKPRVLCGDTLFRGSIGRSDLWGGSPEELLRSICTRLMTLADEVVVFPGHGASTTIGEERKYNPFLQGF